MTVSEESQMPEIWPGLFGRDAQGPYLVGGRCSGCGSTTLQVRSYCPSCWQEDTMAEVPIGRAGTLYTYTVLHQVPPGFQAPLIVGYVDLDDGIRVFAHLKAPSTGLTPGMTLTLGLGPVKKGENQHDIYGPVYEPTVP